MLRASSLGLRLSRPTIYKHAPCFMIRKHKGSLTHSISPLRPFAQSIQSRGRLVRKSKRDERISTVFKQDGHALVGVTLLEGKQRPRDLAPLISLPRFTITSRLPYPSLSVKRNSTLNFTATALGRPLGGFLDPPVHHGRRRASHDAIKGEIFRAVVEPNNFHKPVRRRLTAEERETRKVIQPKDVQELVEEGDYDTVRTIQPTCTEPPYPAGLPWRPFPIKNLRPGKVENDLSVHSHLSINLEGWRRSLLRTLATTQYAPAAWEAYSNLLDLSDDVPVGKLRVPFAHMHRLFRVLARHKPKTRTQFLRLLSVLQAIREAGGEIKLHEWNALIDGAGKGWRTTSVDDFRAAFGIYHDMISGKAPGKSLTRDQDDETVVQAPPIEPDIYTYTTLISIASRTLHAPVFRHATSLLAASGLPPNRITHLSLLRYFTLTKQLSGVRSTLLKMQEQNLELGLDGVNACLWAYSHNGRADLVMTVYRLFRHNMIPETYVGEDDVASVAHRLRVEEHIAIPPDMKPNEITFTTVIQILAHHGNLLATLTVFMDMVSSQNLEMGAPLVPDDSGILKPTPYSPTLPVFRAIFLGFSRHGVRLKEDGTAPSRFRANNPPGQPAWSLANLQALFDTFLALPEDIILSRSTVYWIMVAFEKTSGNDATILRRVWKLLESRFKGPWGGPNNRLHRIQAKLFPKNVDTNGHKS